MPKLKFLLSLLFFGISLGFAYSQDVYLKLEGINERETKIIDSIGYTNRFDAPNVMLSNIDSLKASYEKIGFFEVDFMELKKENDSIYKGLFYLGKQIRTVRVEIAHLEESEFIREFLLLKPEQEYFETETQNLQAFLKRLTERISENGDPFTQVQITRIKKIDDYLSARLEIRSLKERQIGKIILKGYEKFPRSYLKHFLQIKKGKTFNLKRIKKQAAELDNLPFAKQTRDPEVLFTKDSTILYMYIEKQESNNFDGFLGFGTNEENGKLQLDGYLNLNLVNNLNFGESLGIYYKSDENEQRTLDIQLDAPFVLKSPIGISASLNIFRRDSTFLTSQQEASIQYQFGGADKILAGISFRESENLLDDLNQNIQDFDATFYKIQYLRVRRQYVDQLFPLKQRLNFSVAYGKRESNFSSLRQAALVWDGFNNFVLNDKNSIYLGLSGGYLSSDDYLENEQFRFGGIRSIRGFEENTIIADLFAVLNTEYRYKLSPSFYVHSILDYAYYENQLRAIEQDLFGFGFGFGVITQAGLLKLNYAGQKIENQSVQLSDFKIHISLSATF